MKSVDRIMRNVVYALLPVCLFSVLQFGLSALALLGACTLTAVWTEHGICRWMRRETTISDWSAVITGLLMALVLPPGFPLWMAVVASSFAIGIGKMFFGGLGYNVMNPALVGRAFAQATFTVPITTWTPGMAHRRFMEFIPTTFTAPFMQPDMARFEAWVEALRVDGYTGATPLAMMKFDHVEADVMELFLGTLASSAGESSAFLILLGGLYLAFRKMLNWRIPTAVLGSAFLLSGIFYLRDPALYPSPVFTVCSGGLMLGAVFMATDMVSSPVTPLGLWVYGILIGTVTVVIRLFGGLNEGVMYAILLANAASPLINQLTQPKIYGARTRVREAS
jgi:electron transport complex protein RnfD